MKPSIVLIDTYYPQVLSALGFDGAKSLTGTFSKNIDELIDQGFGTGGAYRRGLIRAGWDAQIIVPNSRGVQNVWAKEHGFKPVVQRGWEYSLHLARLPLVRGQLHSLHHVHHVLLKQIEEIKPDVIMVQDLNLIPLNFARKLSKYTKLLVGEIASPLPPKQYFAGYDLIVSALPPIVEQARQWGIKSEYIPLAFDDKWACDIPASEREIDAIFVGSFSRHQPQTIPLLKEIATKVPGFQIYGPASESDLRDEGLLGNYRGQAWGKDMFHLLSQSKIVINRHGTVAGDFAVNMRMYESTGSGAALVTEHKSNLDKLFKPGIEVIAYSDAKNAAIQTQKLLADPQLLDSIASAGYKRTMSTHTYIQRAQQLSEIITRQLG